ncbi:MAG: ArsC family reductase [Vibrionaceae bacterium]
MSPFDPENSRTAPQFTKKIPEAKMDVVLYGIKNCDTVKKAQKWLEQHQIPSKLHDYRQDGLDIDMLERFLRHYPWQVLLNTRSTTYRQLPEHTKNNLNQEIALELMLAQPTLIKRPLMLVEQRCLVGFSAAQYQHFFAGDLPK